MNWNDKESPGKRFEMLLKLWENKSVLIVEGKGTKKGAGNDIFKVSKSVKRIIIPSISDILTRSMSGI